MRIESFELADWEAIAYALESSISHHAVMNEDLEIDLRISQGKVKNILRTLREATEAGNDLPTTAVCLEE